MNVIGDIAGNIDALKRLIDKMPNDDIILVGDLIDRGDYSPEVVQFAMDNEDRITTLMGNHEHMMLDYKLDRGRLYGGRCWKYNGGEKTICAYEERASMFDIDKHLKWMSNLKYYIETDKYLISHSCIPEGMYKEQALLQPLASDYSIIWNRNPPAKIDKIQLFGHNSHWGIQRFFDDEDKMYALCLDDSRMQRIAGYNTNEDKIYQEYY